MGVSDGLFIDTDVQPADPRPERVVSVLGMHRSGTSCLTGSLAQQGLFLGETTPPRPPNTRGHLEKAEIWRMQDEILKANGGAWYSPPRTVEWRPEHLARAREIIAEHAAHPIWGFKDPRTLLTLEGWRGLIPDLQPVAIFRHPLRVAHSLQSRNGLRIERGFELWQAYNERLLRFHRVQPFPVVCFDDEAKTLETKLREAGEMIGLHEAPEDPFFADELRNEPAEGEPLPAEIEALYEELRSLAL